MTTYISNCCRVPEPYSKVRNSRANQLIDVRRLHGAGAKILAHQPAHLELHRPLCRNLNSLKSLWILGNARNTCPCLENPEIAEFQTVILAQLLYDLIQKYLDYLLDGNSFGLSTLCNSVD